MDEDLIDRARAGDADARSALIIALRERLERFAPGLVGEGVGARYRISDLVQSTCVEVCERVDDFGGEGIDDFQRWAKLLLANNIRRKARHDRAQKRGGGAKALPFVEAEDAQGSTPSVHAFRREQLEGLLDLLESISPIDRELLYATRFEGKTAVEVAEQFDFHEATVRRRVAAARAALLVEARRRGLLGGN